MTDCNSVRNNLFNYYGSRIICRVGSACKIQYNVTEKNRDSADIAVYIHEKHRIAVVWNLVERRKNGKSTKTLSVSDDWEKVMLKGEFMRAHYKKMGAHRDAPLEKVLILDIDVLDDIYELLFLYMQINSCDKECPEELCDEDVLSSDIRERVSTSRWERDYKFREGVLKHYGYKCAICRCDEPKLLQAAHIKAVADGGNDDIENGICLCANHHIMLDKGLIKIDYITKKLSYIDDNIKKMAWYNEFIHIYKGMIFC